MNGFKFAWNFIGSKECNFEKDVSLSSVMQSSSSLILDEQNTNSIRTHENADDRGAAIRARWQGCFSNKLHDPNRWKIDLHVDSFGIFAVSMLLMVIFLIFREIEVPTATMRTFQNISRLWLCSLSGGYFVKLFHLPPLFGMLSAGLLAANLAKDWFEIPDKWSAVFTSAGLSVILLRSGLELDVSRLRTSKFLTFKLTVIPGIAEAFGTAVLAVIIFNMPIWLGLSLGFILAAVSPAVVVTNMLDLQHEGYGTSKGIPSLIIAAASFDDILAIGGFSICIAMAIQSENASIIESTFHGPLSIIYGIIIGIIVGCITSLTKLWNKSWKLTIVTLMMCLCTMFGMKSLKYPGSGAMGSMTTGVISSLCWMNSYPSLASRTTNMQTVHEVQEGISMIWDAVFEPLLFGSIGCSLEFDLIPSRSLAKCLLIVCIGSAFRLGSAYLATSHGGLTPRERLFIAFAWLPKATVQAALCTFPLLRVKDNLSPDDMDYYNYIEWTNQILSTAILSICITAPVGVISIKIFGKRWLEHDAKPAASTSSSIGNGDDCNCETAL